MKYEIRLKISHHYAGHVGAGRHLLRLQPAEFPGRQRVDSVSVSVDPPAVENYPLRDFFANSATMLVHDTPHRNMIVSAKAVVTCLDQAGPTLDFSPNLVALAQDLTATSDLGPDSPHHFLGRSPRIQPDAEMAEYARAQIAVGDTTRDTVLAIGAALYRDLTFDAAATSVDTPATEAFCLRRGVCQDFSHILITCLRCIGIPAGYVSGFLRTLPPPGQPRLEGADAMHAWVRAWCGLETGWIEFDPTNGVQPSRDHIVVSRGRDYSDIAPIKGVLKGTGGKLATQTVDVVTIG